MIFAAGIFGLIGLSGVVLLGVLIDDLRARVKALEEKEGGLKLKDVIGRINDFLSANPDATIRGYEGEGGSWVIIEQGDSSLEIQTNYTGDK